MDSTTIRQVLDRLCQEIGGDWLLVGGALVQLEINGERATEDIDLALVKTSHKSESVLQTELFQFTMKNLQIGPESVNLAVVPFLKEFKDWESECILLKSGTVGNIFRPSLTLFVALKMRRASSIDLQDIQSALKKFPLSELKESKLQSWLTESQFQKYSDRFGVKGV